MFKKNDAAIIVKMWNGHTAYLRRCVVESWGRQQGTLKLAENGVMLHERIYTTKLGTWFDVLDPTHDVETLAMAFCVAKYDAKIAHYESCLANSHPHYQNPYYRKLIQAELDELKKQTPSVIWC